MNASIATVNAWSYGLAGIAYAAFALYLSVDRRGGILGRALLVAVGLSAIWGGLGIALAITGNPLLLSASLVADVLRFGGWYAFLLLLIKPKPLQSGESLSRWTWLAGLAGVLVLGGVVAQVMAEMDVTILGTPERLASLVILTAVVFGLVLVEQLFRSVATDYRWNVKPLCLGLAGAFVFDLYLYSDALLFSRLDIDAFSIRGFVHALVIPLVAISTARNRAWSFKLSLSQRVAFHSATLVMVGLYLLFMAAVGYYVRYFGGEWGRAVQLALFFVALLALGILAMSSSMRAKLRVLLVKNFFSYRYDYREEWHRFTQTLSTPGESQELSLQVIRGLADMVESPAGGLWLRNPIGGFFQQAARWNVPAVSETESRSSGFCQFLLDSGWVINLEEFRSMPGRYAGLALPEWLQRVPRAWLVIPLAVRSDLIGFVVLTTARTPIDINWEVNDLLKTAGRQAGSFLGQMQATEALLEARKFDAFNRMSAFVVHDLKNIIAQLSLMLRNAERHRDNPEFQSDMLMTVEHSVERMRQLMMQLREGTTPVDTPRGVDLAEVVRRARHAKAGHGCEVEIQVAEQLIARGHQDRIERVVGHLVQNALDATGSAGRVWVKLERDGERAMLEVGDTGHGMTPDFMRDRLFKPFQTTKQAGMGIGAYESFQYVHELGGEVLVESTVDVGTRVRLLLPLFSGGESAGPGARPKELA